MKNITILHGTGGNSKANWFPWLEKQLKEKGHQVWVPDLPGADAPETKRYTEFLLQSYPWQFDETSIFVGHSSGAVAILRLLESLPKGVMVGTCYLVGAFKDDLGWESLKGLFTTELHFTKIKDKATKFVFIHSDNDPHCPLDGAEFLAKKLNGELLIVPGQQHFSINTGGEQYKEFPFLLDLMRKREI